MGARVTNEFDLTADTTLKGTVHRIGQVVRGACASCSRDDNPLLYDTLDDPTLLCSDCSAKRGKAHAKEPKQPCDSCGATGNVWRDPIHRRNEYLCINCHDPEALFQNRWANKVRESKPLRNSGIVCAAKGYGTDCKGELKWRTAAGMILCNFHAGKKSAGPDTRRNNGTVN